MFYQSHVLPKSGLLQNGNLQNSVLPKSCSTKVQFHPKWDSTQFRSTKVSPAINMTDGDRYVKSCFLWTKVCRKTAISPAVCLKIPTCKALRYLNLSNLCYLTFGMLSINSRSGRERRKMEANLFSWVIRLENVGKQLFVVLPIFVHIQFLLFHVWNIVDQFEKW
jgi:hypothetical protein